MADKVVRCGFCGKAESMEGAMEAGWTPYYYLDEQTEADLPACPACAAEHLDFSDGEPILKGMLGVLDPTIARPAD